MGEPFDLDRHETNILDYLVYVFDSDVTSMINSLEETQDNMEPYNRIPSDMMVCDNYAAEIWFIDKGVHASIIMYSSGGQPSRLSIDEKIGKMFVRIQTTS
jgi:hypothetical protein